MSQLLKVRRVIDVRQIRMRTANSLVPELRPQILAQPIQAEEEALRSEIHKLIHSTRTLPNIRSAKRSSKNFSLLSGPGSSRVATTMQNILTGDPDSHLVVVKSLKHWKATT
jgi:hypothetical protein